MNILKAGMRERAALDKLESQLAGVMAEMERIAKERVPHEETRERLKRAIERDVYRRVPEGYFNSFQNADERYTGGESGDRGFITLGDLAYLIGVDTLLDMMMTRIKANGESVGLPASERAKKLQELRGQLHELERKVEFEVLRLEEAGHTILRRRDADVAVLFEVWAEKAGDVTKAAETVASK